MQEQVSLTIFQLKQMLQNTPPSSLSQLQEQNNFTQPLKIVSFVDIDEFIETSTQMSPNQSVSGRVQELEEENRILKEEIIQYKTKQHEWANEIYDYQKQCDMLKSENKVLLNKIRSLTQYQNNEQKILQTVKILESQTTQTNQIKKLKQSCQVKIINVNKLSGFCGIKSQSPHRMFSEKNNQKRI